MTGEAHVWQLRAKTVPEPVGLTTKDLRDQRNIALGHENQSPQPQPAAKGGTTGWTILGRQLACQEVVKVALSYKTKNTRTIQSREAYL